MNKKPRSWLDLLLNRKLKPADPDRSREHLASNPLTYDRRRSAQLAAAAAEQPAPSDSPAAAPPRGQLYRNDDRSVAETLRQQFQDGASEVEVQADVVSDTDAAGDAAGLRRAPRRASKRVLAPADFRYCIEPHHFVRLELTVLLFEGRRPRALNCFLYDVSDQGLGFACPEQLQVGDSVSVCAHLSEDMDPLVDAVVEIRNVRPMPEHMERPERFGNQPLWIHGALLEPESALVMLKATLDCIALQVATGGEVPPVADGSGDEDRADAEAAGDDPDQ